MIEMSKTLVQPAERTVARARRVQEGTLIHDSLKFRMVAGNICNGLLLSGRHLPIVGLVGGPEDTRIFYRVLLHRPAFVDSYDNGRYAECQPGEIVELPEDDKLRGLCDEVMVEIEAGAEYLIHYEVLRFIRVDASSGIWSTDLQVKRNHPPRA